MTVRELSNRYYTWNNRIVFIHGNWDTLWNGGECELLVCEKKASRSHLYESPFQTTDERIPITGQVLSELKPILVKCDTCVYCRDVQIPVGRCAIGGFEHGRICDLKNEVDDRRWDIPDGIALSPDCPCFSEHPLTEMKTERNEKLDNLSKAAFHTYNAWFVASDYGFPNEATVFSLLGESKTLYVISYNEGADTDFEYNRTVNWTIRAWCEISLENNTTQALRSIWDAVFFRSERTTAMCSLETKKLLFLPFGIPEGYYVFSKDQGDSFLETHGKRVQWK